MDSVWYYVRNGAQTGPVSFDELRAVAASGQLAGTDLVWKEGTPDWVVARSVTGLFSGPPPVRSAGDRGYEPPAPAEPRGPSRAAEVFALAREFVLRAVNANPAGIAPSPAEEERLAAAGMTDPLARRYAVWRRAVLWVSVVPTAFAAVFGLIDAIAMDKAETEHLSNFGVLLTYLQAFAVFALPLAAVMAANAYHDLTASARWVVLGAAVSLGVPLGIAFVPSNLVLSSRAEGAAVAVQGFVMGLGYYLTLTPAILSLLPAVSRGCVRVKSFLPQSLVPGWGLVASVPLFVLLTLATLVLLYKFVGNFLLVLGLILWIGAPLLYLTKYRLLTRPMTEQRDTDELAKTQVAVASAIVGGVVLIVLYLFTAKLGDMRLLGFDSKDSILQPWSLDLHTTWTEFVGRSLFLTVLFADLMVRMALSVWREERAFAGTDAAKKFDRTMSGLLTAVEPKDAPPVA